MGSYVKVLIFEGRRERVKRFRRTSQFLLTEEVVSDTYIDMRIHEHKVKYTRREYREEYLKSDEWLRKRDTFVKAHPICELCKSAKTWDVHHVEYRNIVDVTGECMMSLCRECHKLVHRGVQVGLVDLSDPLQKKREDTLALTRDLVLEREKRLRTKTPIPDEILRMISCVAWSKKQLIRGILKWGKPTFDGLDQILVSQSKIEKIISVFSGRDLNHSNGSWSASEKSRRQSGSHRAGWFLKS